MEGCPVVTLLWILAVILVISGIVAIMRKQLVWGLVLIVVGLLVGPGGVSIFTWRPGAAAAAEHTETGPDTHGTCEADL